MSSGLYISTMTGRDNFAQSSATKSRAQITPQKSACKKQQQAYTRQNMTRLFAEADALFTTDLFQKDKTCNKLIVCYSSFLLQKSANDQRKKHRQKAKRLHSLTESLFKHMKTNRHLFYSLNMLKLLS